MAPESERAKGFCGKQMTQCNPGTGAMFCNFAPGHEGSCSYTYFFRDDSQPDPTLTCSEVVLRSKIESRNGWYEPYVYFDEHTGFRGRTCSTEEAANDELKRILETLNHLTPRPIPIVTCSEVVERLAKIAEDCKQGIDERYGADIAAQAIRAHAPAILHEWRERRVQELENLLAKRSGCSHCADSASGITSTNDSSEIRKEQAAKWLGERKAPAVKAYGKSRVMFTYDETVGLLSEYAERKLGE